MLSFLLHATKKNQSRSHKDDDRTYELLTSDGDASGGDASGGGASGVGASPNDAGASACANGGDASELVQV